VTLPIRFVLALSIHPHKERAVFIVLTYMQHTYPKCNGYLGIVVPELKAKTPVQAINGRCLKCGYRLAALLVLGKRLTRQTA
jgi:hypothetical protein